MRKAWSLLLTSALLLGLAGMPALAGTAGFRGVVIDRMGRPIHGAEVEVYRLGMGLVEILRTNVSGAFIVRSYDDGGSEFLQFRVWARGFRTFETGWFYPIGQRHRSIRLESMTGGLSLWVTDGEGGLISGSALLAGPGEILLGEHELGGGELLLDDVMAGEYRAIVMAPGFTTSVQRVAVRGGSNANLAVNLERANVRLSGEVRDEFTGALIPGAAIEVLTAEDRQVTATQSDRTGRFQMTALPLVPGSYQFRLSAPGYRPRLAEFDIPTAGARLDWTGGDGFALQPLEGMIHGLLMDQHGNIQREKGVFLELKGYGVVDEAVTADTGEFEFDLVPAGPGHLYRFSAGWQDQFVITDWMELKAGQVNQVTVQPRVIYGHGDSVGSIWGSVASLAGEMLSGAKVELLRRDQPVRSVDTDEKGAFLFERIPTTQAAWYVGEPYTLRVSMDGYISTQEGVVSGNDDPGVHVVANARTLVQVRLHQASPSVRGRVLDTEGSPVSGATVEWLEGGGDVPIAALTNEEGWYSLSLSKAEPTRDYALRVAAEGYTTVTGIEITDAMARTEALPTVRLTPVFSAVSGQVLSADGRALAEVRVQLRGRGGSVLGEALSDSRGMYRIEADLTFEGILAITAEREGMLGSLGEVTGGHGKDGVVNLVLFPATYNVEGRVVTRGGAPVSGVWAELLAEGIGPVGQGRTDQNGHVQFDGVPGRVRWLWLRVGGAGTGMPLYRLRIEPGGDGM